MKGWLLRLYRFGIIAGAGWLLREQTRQSAWSLEKTVTLIEAQRVFPQAASLASANFASGGCVVRDAAGNVMGYAMKTSPEGDRCIGYSGPSNLLIGLDENGAVVGIQILTSNDTPEHVDQIRAEPQFLAQFVGWNPRRNLLPEIDAVSGATLTSFAMAEAVETKLRGAAPSLRFPEPVELAEAKLLFPAAVALRSSGPIFHVTDVSDKEIGQLWRTSPEADSVIGYQGPTESLLGLAADGRTLQTVLLRRSYDTPSYVDQVRQDPTYLRVFSGRTMETLAGLDFAKEQIEGVSGATLTSYAVAESIKRRCAAAATTADASAQPSSRWTQRDIVLVILTIGAGVMAFSPLRGNRWVRRLWQGLLIGYLGLAGGDFLSLALLAGWAQHGIPWRSAPGLLLLAAASLAFPWLTRRQLYCHHLCPHGAAQQWLGRLRRKKWTLPPHLGRWLEKFPAILLSAAMLLLVSGASLNLAAWEPFDAWVFRAGAWFSGILAVLGLTLAVFVPQAYCRYGCPTGALLRFLRSCGSSDHFSRRDAAGLILLVTAAALLFFPSFH